MKKPTSLQRLLAKSGSATYLQLFAPLLPGRALLLVQANGLVITQSGEAPAADWTKLLAQAQAEQKAVDSTLMIQAAQFDRLRIYPLSINGEWMGALVVTQAVSLPPLTVDPAIAIEKALYQGLILLLERSMERRALAAELLDCYRQLNLLYRMATTVGCMHDPNLILRQVLEESKTLIEADAGIIYLAADKLHTDSNAYYLLYQVRRPEGASTWAMRATYGRQERIVALHKAVRAQLEQAETLPRTIRLDDFSPGCTSKPGRTRFRMLLCTPIQTTAEPFGCIVLGRLFGQSDFDDPELKFLEVLANQAAVAMENARHYQTMLTQERVTYEAHVIQDVQNHLIPRGAPYFPNWAFETWWQPARTINGDFYDFLPFPMSSTSSTAATSSPQTLGVVVADVAGQGMAAALFMALVRSSLRAFMNNTASLAEAVTKLNRLVCQDAKQGMFVTLFCAILDSAHGEVTYVNAGHPPALYYQPQTQTLMTLERTGILLGWDEAQVYEQQTVVLAPGDCLLLYTNGITEATNPAGERFGQERLVQMLQTYCLLPTANFMRGIQRTLRTFLESDERTDDMTLVLIKRQ